MNTKDTELRLTMIMQQDEHTFASYMNHSRMLFMMLFGEKQLKKLESMPLKSIDWHGIDIDCDEITAVFPNLTDRFNEEWIDYFSETGVTLFDLFLQTIFHFGYQQCYDKNVGNSNEIYGK